MNEMKYEPVRHDHRKFLETVSLRDGFQQEYQALDFEYQLIAQLLAARSDAGLTQDAVAKRMGTSKSAVSRLESGGKHTPSLATLRRYAHAVGCDLEVKLVPVK